MNKPLEQESPEPKTDDVDDDEMFARREREGRVGVGDFVRRAIENTVGSVQNTSSTTRDALQYLLHQGDKGRKEILRIVAKEVGDFLHHVDLSSEIIKVLTNVEMDFNASVRFKRVGNSVKPEFSKQSGVSVTEPESSEPPPAEPTE
jgi:hypothetical protein